MDTNSKLDLDKLIKLMKMTTSSMDGEALTAIRMANSWLTRNNYDWEAVLRGKITVIADPFGDAPAPVRQPDRAAPPPPRRPRPQPAPKPQYTSPPQPKPAPAQPKPAPQFAAPSFTKNSAGDWCVRSATPLNPGDILDVTTRKGGVRTVVIGTSYGKNSFGDYLYASQNAAPTQLGDLA